MNTSTEPFNVSSTAPEMARRFAMIMAGLGALIARRFLKMPHLSGFTVLLWNRLSRAVRRLERVLARPPAKARAPRAHAERRENARARQPGLPSGREWIVRELGWEAAAYMGHLEVLLAEPETQALLARFPGAGRILRPFCRMLGVPVAAATPAAVVADTPPEVVSAEMARAVSPPAPLPGGWPRAAPTGMEGVAQACAVRPTGW
jgi:hypothetical protein